MTGIMYVVTRAIPLFVLVGVFGFSLVVILGITSLPSVTATLSWKEFSFIQSGLGWTALVFLCAHDMFYGWPYMNGPSCGIPSSFQVVCHGNNTNTNIPQYSVRTLHTLPHHPTQAPPGCAPTLQPPGQDQDWVCQDREAGEQGHEAGDCVKVFLLSWDCTAKDLIC